MTPEHPVYIISKGRAKSRLTARVLDVMGVPYTIVVEAQEADEYRSVILDPSRVVVLDPAYQREYDPCCVLDEGQSKGSGPARNFVWDHAAARGAESHWLLDDNIRRFYRWHRNRKIEVRSGAVFRAMEEFCGRYTNVALAGPCYERFAPISSATPAPFRLNTRIYSCILIRNDIPFRWRARYNEDTDLSLRVLKAGWCTVEFNAFLQDKTTTQKLKGGNTDELYAHGTLEKSRMIARLHPDVARLVWRFNRWHHDVDYGRFKRNRLIRKHGVVVPEGVDEYGMRLVSGKP